MSGARILLVLLAVGGALLWAALVGPRSAEDRRGWEEAERAFAAYAAELEAFEPVFEDVTAQGLMIELRTTAQRLRDQLADLRARRLALREDDELPEGKRLPAYRELARESDVALSQLRSLRRAVEARWDFFRAANPLLLSTRRQRDLLAARQGLAPEQARRRDELAGLFAEMEARAKQAQSLLQRAPTQNAPFAEAVVKDLAVLDAQQKALLETLAD